MGVCGALPTLRGFTAALCLADEFPVGLVECELVTALPGVEPRVRVTVEANAVEHAGDRPQQVRRAYSRSEEDDVV